MKVCNLIATLALASALTGCAALNDSLKQANELLGKATSSLSTDAGVNGKSYSVPDKVTSQYEIRNLRLATEQISDVTNIRFTGQAFNKTNKLIKLEIAVPKYKNGYYVSEVQKTITIPANEKSQIDGIEPFALQAGQVLKPQKTKVSVSVY